METLLLAEHRELCANMRHYVTHYVTLLGVFLALNGVLVTVVFGAKAPNSWEVLLLMKITGLIMAAIFWLNILSCNYLWGHFFKRAKEIESQLGFQQYSSLPVFPPFRRPADITAHFLLICLGLFWLITLFL